MGLVAIRLDRQVARMGRSLIIPFAILLVTCGRSPARGEAFEGAGGEGNLFYFRYGLWKTVFVAAASCLLYFLFGAVQAIWGGEGREALAAAVEISGAMGMMALKEPRFLHRV